MKAAINQRSHDSFDHRNNKDIFEAYMQEAKSYDLLSHEREIELFSDIETGVAAYEAADFSREISSQQTDAFIKLAAAYQVVFVANLRLVVKFASPYFKYEPLPKMDLVSEGNEALARVIGMFDASQDYKFSTYASHAIKHHIYRVSVSKSRLIRIPEWKYEQYINAKAKIEALTDRLGRKPKDKEIEAEIGMKAKDFSALAIQSRRHPLLLSTSGYIDELGDFFKDRKTDTTHIVDKLTSQQQIRSIFQVAGLNKQEILVVGLKFNLDPNFLAVLGTDLKHEEDTVATKQGAGLSSLEQIENSALAKLKSVITDFEEAA